jgi:hypothetical protein
MSERKVGIGVKALIITLLCIFIFTYVAVVVIKAIYFETDEVMLDKDRVRTLIYNGSSIGVWTVNALSFLFGVGLIGFLGLRGMDLKLKYNLIYSMAIISTLLVFLGVVPFYIEQILLVTTEGFTSTEGMTVMLILTIIGGIMFILVGIIAKLQTRKL